MSHISIAFLARRREIRRKLKKQFQREARKQATAEVSTLPAPILVSRLLRMSRQIDREGVCDTLFRIQAQLPIYRAEVLRRLGR